MTEPSPPQRIVDTDAERTHAKLKVINALYEQLDQCHCNTEMRHLERAIQKEFRALHYHSGN